MLIGSNVGSNDWVNSTTNSGSEPVDGGVRKREDDQERQLLSIRKVDCYYHEQQEGDHHWGKHYAVLVGEESSGPCRAGGAKLPHLLPIVQPRVIRSGDSIRVQVAGETTMIKMLLLTFLVGPRLVQLLEPAGNFRNGREFGRNRG